LGNLVYFFQTSKREIFLCLPIEISEEKEITGLVSKINQEANFTLKFDDITNFRTVTAD